MAHGACRASISVLSQGLCRALALPPDACAGCGGGLGQDACRLRQFTGMAMLLAGEVPAGMEIKSESRNATPMVSMAERGQGPPGVVKGVEVREDGARERTACACRNGAEDRTPCLVACARAESR